jgi:hypothetical protein
MALAALLVTIGVGPVSMATERDDLERALAHALQQENRDLLTEQNLLPETGEPIEAALVFLVKKGCIKVRKLTGTPDAPPRNEWSLGDGCGKECHLGKLTSPWLSGDGLTCRVARQRDIRIVDHTPPANDANGALRTRVSYEAKLDEVADWAKDPEYVVIWKSYGLDLQSFHAFAEMVKTPEGWVPYQ